MVSSYSGQLQGASSAPWWCGWWQFALVIASDAMVASLAITKQGRQRRHGVWARGTWLLLVLQVLCCGSLSLARGDGRERKACVDDPI